jgi:hypothetical protein
MRVHPPVLALLLLAAACGKDATSPQNSVSSPVVLARGSMGAKVDGATWNATLAVSAVNNNGIIAIAGNDGTQTLGFGLAANGTGTYTIGPLSPTNGLLIQSGGAAWTANLSRGSGTVTVTSLTAAAVAGTFSFTLVASPGTPANANKVISDGVFNIRF